MTPCTRQHLRRLAQIRILWVTTEKLHGYSRIVDARSSDIGRTGANLGMEK